MRRLLVIALYPSVEYTIITGGGGHTPTSEDRGPIDWPEYRKRGESGGGPCSLLCIV